MPRRHRCRLRHDPDHADRRVPFAVSAAQMDAAPAQSRQPRLRERHAVLLRLTPCYSKRAKSATGAIGSSRILSKQSRGGTLLCRKRSVLRRGSVQEKLYPCSESPGSLWPRRPVDRRRMYRRRLWRRRLSDRQPTHSGGIPRRFGSPLSMRRKSPTSAWRRFTSSTMKTSETPGQAYNLPLCGEAAAADTAVAAEAAAAEAAAAFEAAADTAAQAAEAADGPAEAAASAAAAGEAAAAAAAAA